MSQPHLRRRLGLLLSTTLLLAGCAGTPNDVVFVTKTSFALDVSSQPPGASIGYDRVEGYVGPRPDSGRVPPVAASFVTEGKLFDRQIRQVYATGRAAELVTGAAPSPAQTAAPPPAEQQSPVLFFSTGTTLGLKLGFGSAGVTDWVTLGYKRRELSLIPLTGGEFPSVLASIDSDTDAAQQGSTKLGVGQYFATGSAAQALAADEEVQQLFRHRMRDALGGVERAEKTQAEAALVTLSCLARLPDADLPRVFRHAGKVKLFEADAPGLADKLRDMPAAEARSSYTRYVAASDGSSAARGLALNEHRGVVCALAGN